MARLTGTNPLLISAAFAGFIQGALSGRPVADPVPAALVAAAAAFATEVDSLITIQTAAPAISVGSTSIAPTTGPIIEAEIGSTNVMQGICAGLMQGRYTTDATAADYAAVAANVVQFYTAAIAVGVSIA